jgi:hypothetical protein
MNLGLRGLIPGSRIVNPVWALHDMQLVGFGNNPISSSTCEANVITRSQESEVRSQSRPAILTPDF